MIHVLAKEAIAQVRRGFKDLSKKEVNIGIYRAINHTIAKSKTYANRQIRSEYAVSLKAVNDHLSIIKAHSNNLQAILRASGRPLPLYGFKPRQTKSGVSVMVRKGQRHIIRKSFLATMKSGHTGVFARGKYAGGQFNFRNERKANSGGYKVVNGRYQPVKNDLEINELTTVSIPKAFSMPSVITPVVRDMSDTMQKRLVHELVRIRGKA